MRHIASILVLIVVSIFRCETVSAQFELGEIGGFQERKNAAINELKNFPNADTNRVNALMKVFTAGTFLKERQEVLPYRLEGLAISRKLKYARGLAACYLSAGHYYKSAANYRDALVYFDSVIYITSNAKDMRLLEWKSMAYRWKGAIYFEQENYYTALDHFFEALKYADYNNKKTNIRLNEYIAEIYTTLNNLERALDYAQRNVKLLEDDTSWSARTHIYFMMIDIYLAKHELEPVFQYLDKMAPRMPDPKEVQMTFGYYLKRGHANFQQQRYNDAYMYYQYAFKYAIIGGHKRSRIVSLRCLSATALKLGDQDAAKKYALENLQLAEEINTQSEKAEALINLSNYYNASGNKGKAYDLMQQALSLKDSVLSAASVKQMNILGAIYEAEKQDKEINRLQREKDKQAADAAHSSVLNRIYFASIMALLVVGYLGYIAFRKNQQLAHNQQALQRQKIIDLEKDKQLLSIDAMLKGQEEERSRIAKDLHDGLGSLLSGTKLSFMNVKENLILSAENAVIFDKSLDMLDNTIGDLRKVAQNLMPEGLVKFGLTEALRDFCESIQSTSGINVLYQDFGEIRRLDNTAEVFIYRIIQELVNNAIKYAEASQVLVQLTMSSDKAVITVEDNGKGFDQAILSKTKGMGMANIKYRVQYFNGTTDIVTAPGKGTSVNIELKV